MTKKDVDVFANKTNWTSDTLVFQSVSDGYGAGTTHFAGGALTYSSSTIYHVGSDWQTWSGNYSGEVIFEAGTSLTLKLNGASAFGFELEPNQFEKESFTLTLSNGQTVTRTIHGDHGAQFFGFAGMGITSVTITSNSGDSFAVGNFDIVGANGLDYRASASGDSIISNIDDVTKNYGFICEYLGSGASYLNHAKANAIIDSGASIVSLYEIGKMGKADYYSTDSYDNGAEIGEAAYRNAFHDGQTAYAGSAIYFGIDIPDAAKKVGEDVEDFFKGIRHGFEVAAKKFTDSKVELAVGVYGSGEICDLIKDQDHLASFSMLSGSKGWPGFKAYDSSEHWDIEQSIVPGKKIHGVGVDLDKNHGSYFGQWGGETQDQTLGQATHHAGDLTF